MKTSGAVALPQECSMILMGPSSSLFPSNSLKKNPAVVAGSLLSSLFLTTDFGGCFCCQLQNLSAPAVSQCRKLILQKNPKINLGVDQIS